MRESEIIFLREDYYETEGNKKVKNYKNKKKIHSSIQQLLYTILSMTF